jgi:hypothetical protein
MPWQVADRGSHRTRRRIDDEERQLTRFPFPFTLVFSTGSSIGQRLYYGAQSKVLWRTIKRCRPRAPSRQRTGKLLSLVWVRLALRVSLGALRRRSRKATTRSCAPGQPGRLSLQSVRQRSGGNQVTGYLRHRGSESQSALIGIYFNRLPGLLRWFYSLLGDCRAIPPRPIIDLLWITILRQVPGRTWGGRSLFTRSS